MLIPNETLAQPASPPKRWGVEVRTRTLKDYRNVIIASAIFLVVLFFIVSFGWFGVNLSKDDRLGVILLFGIPSAIAVMATLSDPGKVLKEAEELASQRFYQWGHEVLFPFLEEKYGIEIPPQSLLSWRGNYAYKDKQTIEFVIHGLILEEDNFCAGNISPAFYNIRLEEIWLEEVIRPDTARYRALEEA